MAGLVATGSGSRPGIGEDEDGFLTERLGGLAGEGIARVDDLQHVDGLGPQASGAVAQDAAHLVAGQPAAHGNVFGIVEVRVFEGAQVDVEPFLLVGLAGPLAGEVEIGEDFLPAYRQPQGVSRTTPVTT